MAQVPSNLGFDTRSEWSHYLGRFEAKIQQHYLNPTHVPLLPGMRNLLTISPRVFPSKLTFAMYRGELIWRVIWACWYTGTAAGRKVGAGGGFRNRIFEGRCSNDGSISSWNTSRGSNGGVCKIDGARGCGGVKNAREVGSSWEEGVCIGVKWKTVSWGRGFCAGAGRGGREGVDDSEDALFCNCRTEARGISGTAVRLKDGFCGVSHLCDMEEVAIHRDDRIVTVLWDMNAIRTVHNGLLGDVTAPIDYSGFCVLLCLTERHRDHIFNKLITANSVCVVRSWRHILVGYLSKRTGRETSYKTSVVAVKISESKLSNTRRKEVDQNILLNVRQLARRYRIVPDEYRRPTSY